MTDATYSGRKEVEMIACPVLLKKKTFEPTPHETLTRLIAQVNAIRDNEGFAWSPGERNEDLRITALRLQQLQELLAEQYRRVPIQCNRPVRYVAVSPFTGETLHVCSFCEKRWAKLRGYPEYPLRAS